MNFITLVIFEETKEIFRFIKLFTEHVFFKMVFLFLLQGCNFSCIVVLFAVLPELASARLHTLLKLASSVCTHFDTLL